MTATFLKTSTLEPELLSAMPGAASVDTGLRLDVIHDEAEFLALEYCWDDLLKQSATRSPFLSWDWVKIWWDEHRDAFKLAIGVVRTSGNKTLAIAPLVIGREAEGSRSQLWHLTFIGGMGEIAFQGMDFIVPVGHEEILTPLLCGVFAKVLKRIDLVRLTMIPEESPNLPHILQALKRKTSGVSQVNRQPSRILSLPASWEDIERSHGGNWRSNMRRKQKKMETEHQGRVIIGGRDVPFDVAFEALLELHGQRWSIEESLFLHERTKRFHQRLCHRCAADGRMMIVLLELDGKYQAATYCLIHDNKAWFYQAGWNQDYCGMSIGKLALAWTVRHAIELGLREFDFLPVDYSYKQEWADGVRHVVDIEAFNPRSSSAAIFRFLRFCKRKASPLQAATETANTTCSE